MGGRFVRGYVCHRLAVSTSEALLTAKELKSGCSWRITHRVDYFVHHCRFQICKDPVLRAGYDTLNLLSQAMMESIKQLLGRNGPSTASDILRPAGPNLL